MCEIKKSSCFWPSNWNMELPLTEMGNTKDASSAKHVNFEISLGHVQAWHLGERSELQI